MEHDTTKNDLDFEGRVALVTGAGRGLGREHALLLASRGCKVVVNDLGRAFDGTGADEQHVADEVVDLIKTSGGEATANYDSVEEGERIIESVLAAYGRLDIVINNAGILTPEVWSDLTLESWQRTINVNLTGVFTVMKAAWPVFVRQQYGRCIMTASPAIFGAGVAAYAASKAGVIGLANSLQFEAKKLKLDIKCNVLVPQADTRMTRDFGSAIDQRRLEQGKPAARSAPVEVMQRLSPDKVSAMAVWLAHESCHAEALVHEAGGGYFAQLRWARSAPLFATEIEGVEGSPVPENIRDGQQILADFDNGDMPVSGDGSMGSPTALDQVFGHLKASREN
ncbi:MAG: 3-hydroxyacyl-CoA dehydrogenase/3a,7a,12a-trihydroxy-5b-cholest-24-enoyl-CoA hydratase [Gammaproteobacteria bacterium]|jgi:3-hydroxyacyl-CoA dehydrogenase/3a,7a,12a-trihydroxy-5b-cholest-24-enoyl-CoA hydratase